MLVALDTIAPGKAPGLRVSADPVQPREAIDWFGRKTPLDKKAWGKLSEEARKRAFTAAWVTDLRVLQSVKDSLRQAIENGESFESWKGRIRSELGAKWKRDNSYLETVFRNNVQSAYAAGRYKAQTTPTILRLRPFWRLVVLLDKDTSEFCKPLVNPPVILPVDDPWWLTGYPPRHGRCRSTTVTLSRRQAERAGILKTAPRVRAQEGWGSIAGLGEWQPTGQSLDPSLFKPAEKAAAKALPKAEPAVEPPAKVTPVVIEEPKKAEPKPKAKPPAAQTPAAKKQAEAAPKQPPKKPAAPQYVPPKLSELTPRNIDTLPVSGKLDMTEESRAILEKVATPDEREAIAQYTGSHYKAIRAYESGMSESAMVERFGERGLDIAKRTSPLIRSAFDKVPASPMVVYRGLSDVPRATVEAILAAGAFETEATTSTSRHPVQAQDFANANSRDVLAVFYIIRQKSGIMVEGISKWKSEREILIAKGKRFRILSAHRDASDPQRVIIEVEEV